MGSEGLELLGRLIVFRASIEPDEILEQLADRRMMAEMQKVFFSDEPNSLGHSYAKLLCGPDGRSDLQDVIALLQKEPLTKRALVTFSPQPGGKVPCVNAIQFLVRERALQLIYFARGQDAFKKFYADAFCLVKMGHRISTTLGIPLGTVRGFVGSSHIYQNDMGAIERTLSAVNKTPIRQTVEGARA
jgi:thymidylate synthase